MHFKNANRKILLFKMYLKTIDYYYYNDILNFVSYWILFLYLFCNYNTLNTSSFIDKNKHYNIKIDVYNKFYYTIILPNNISYYYIFFKQILKM